MAADGTVYIADSLNHRIRMIRNNQVSTLAGSGISGFLDGPAAQARFRGPQGVAVAPDGTVYVADTSNHRVRMIRDGQVSTLAGSGERGDLNGAAAHAQFSALTGIAVAPDGSILVTDYKNHRVRKISNGQVSTFSGSGLRGLADGEAHFATFACPFGISVSLDGTVYVADLENGRIRVIRNGQVSTLAFRSDTSFSVAIVVAAQDGTFYISDPRNHCVRMIRDGRMSTVAGCDKEGFADGPAANALLRAPSAVALAPNGTMYIADFSGHRIRILRNGQVATVAGNGEPGFADGPTSIDISTITDTTMSLMERCIGIAADLSVPINDNALQFQRSFVSRRCPGLLKSALRIQPVDLQSIALFQKFLYTEQIPDNLGLTQLMGLSVRLCSLFSAL